MNPTYRYSALYAGITSTTGWGFEAGALGRDDDGGWHMAYSRTRDLVTFALRLEGVSPRALCNDTDPRILYAIPEGRFKLPVTGRFTVRAAASYRGKLSYDKCNFHPSMLNLDLYGEWALPPNWTVGAGVGHYGLHDFGDGEATGPWKGGRDRSVEYIHLGGRYVWQRMTFLSDLRGMAYAGNVWELLLGVEFRSSPVLR
jgi:hypothetical protein